MKFEASSLQKLSSSQQRVLLIAGGGLLATFAIYFLLLTPAQENLGKIESELTTSMNMEEKVKKDLSSRKYLEKQAATNEIVFATYKDEGLIEPLLGSYGMQVKSLLDPIALENGVTISGFQENPVITIPMPKSNVDNKPFEYQQLYVRLPVSVTCEGDYFQIVAFIKAVETKFPLVALSGMMISSLGVNDKGEATRQKADLTFEWLIKGEKVLPPTPAAGKKK